MRPGFDRTEFNRYLANDTKRRPEQAIRMGTLPCEEETSRTVLFSFVTIFLFTNATRHLFTRAWVRSGGTTRSSTACNVRFSGIARKRCTRTLETLTGPIKKPFHHRTNLAMQSLTAWPSQLQIRHQNTKGDTYRVTSSILKRKRERDLLHQKLAKNRPVSRQARQTYRM
jgi:hypothetical protein